MRPQLINQGLLNQGLALGVKAVTLPPRLVGRVAGGVAGHAVGTVRLLTDEVLDRVRPDQAPEPDGGTLRPVPSAERPMAGTAGTLAETIAEATPDGPAVDHADLPIEDFDHLTLGSVRSRIRSLGLVQLGQLQAYEAAHANRLPVLTVLTNRIKVLEGQPTSS